MKVLGYIALGLVAFVVAVGYMGGSDDKAADAAAPAAVAVAQPAPKTNNRNEAKVAAIHRQIARLSNKGQRLAGNTQNPCAVIPKFSAIVDRIDDLVYKLQDLGYPSTAVEEANDNTRMKLADLIGICLR